MKDPEYVPFYKKWENPILIGVGVLAATCWAIGAIYGHNGTENTASSRHEKCIAAQESAKRFTGRTIDNQDEIELAARILEEGCKQ